MASFVFYITWIASSHGMTSNHQSNHLNHVLKSNSDACTFTEICPNKPFHSPLQRSASIIAFQFHTSLASSSQCDDASPFEIPIDPSLFLSQSISVSREHLTITAMHKHTTQEHNGGTLNTTTTPTATCNATWIASAQAIASTYQRNDLTTGTRPLHVYTNKHTKQEPEPGTPAATRGATWTTSTQAITVNRRANNINYDLPSNSDPCSGSKWCNIVIEGCCDMSIPQFPSSISPISSVIFAEIRQNKPFHSPLQHSASDFVFQSRTTRVPSCGRNAHGFELPIAISASDMFPHVGHLHNHTKQDVEAASHLTAQIHINTRPIPTAKSRKFAHTTCSLFEATSSSNYIPFVHDIYYLGVPGFVDCDYGHRNMYYVAVFLSLITFIIHFRKQVKGSVVLIVCVAFTSCSASDIFIWCGGTSSNFLVSNGTMKAWGRNTYGNLGYGDTNHRGDSINEMGNYLPELDLGSNFFVTQVSASPVTTCALSSLNQVKCWGDNSVYGILGYGDKVNRWNAGTVPVVDVGFDVIQLAGGQEHRCAISDLNRVKCWGGNTYGQLGLGDTNKRGWGVNEMGNYLPEVDLGSNFNAILIEGEGHHACAVSSSNIVKCWGKNGQGQLGLGDINSRGDNVDEMGDNLPEVDLGIDFNVTQIALGFQHTCALSSLKKVKCWGLGGRLGLGDTIARGNVANQMGNNLPEVDLGSNFIVAQIVAGWHHTCAVSTLNALKCWGDHTYGALGYEDTNSRGDAANEMGDNLPEVDLGSNFNVAQVALGVSHSCALSTLNTVKCWGRNDLGQLGQGDTVRRGMNPGEMGNNLPLVDIGQDFVPLLTASPSSSPTNHPSTPPTMTTSTPSSSPSDPTAQPSISPSDHPSSSPTLNPSVNPSITPTANPSI
eukprot:82704_1